METRKRVLLVDDIRLFLEMERSFFSRDQVEIAVARDGAEALQAAQVLRPHLVIMDLHMPVMDGAEACWRIKQDPALAAIPVVLMTEDDSAAEQERCLVAGCDAILPKPLKRRQLLRTARKFLQVAERAAVRVPSRMLVHYGIDEQQTLHDFSVNLAAGGLFLATAQKIPLDTPLTLEFFIPGASTTIRCRGRVAWTNPSEKPAKPELPGGFGVQFFDLSPEDAESIQAFTATDVIA